MHPFTIAAIGFGGTAAYFALLGYLCGRPRWRAAFYLFAKAHGIVAALALFLGWLS